MFKRVNNLVSQIAALALAALAFLPTANAAPLLLTEGDQLIGAKGVVIDRISYDVSLWMGHAVVFLPAAPNLHLPAVRWPIGRRVLCSIKYWLESTM